MPAIPPPAGGRVWSVYHGDLDAAGARPVHAKRLHVLAWTVNESADIDRVLDLGVDGIVSDRPALRARRHATARAILARRDPRAVPVRAARGSRRARIARAVAWRRARGRAGR